MAKLGVMRHRVVIRRIVRTDDEGGGTSRADTNLATVWARVEKIGATEKAAYGQLQERATHTIILRARDDVDNGQTIMWLKPGAAEPAPGSTTVPDARPMYVLTSVEANPDRPGEFIRLVVEERSTI